MKMKVTQLAVYIEQDEDGMYIGSVPSIPSCYAEGKTQEEMMRNLTDVVKLCLRNTGEKDMPKSRFIGIQTLDLSHA